MCYLKMARKKKKQIEDIYFQNIKGLKKEGIKLKFTPKQKKEIAKCAEDPIYFIENYVKIKSLDEKMILMKLRDYQIDMIKNIYNNRYTIAMMARQMGKCAASDTKIEIIKSKPKGFIKKIVFKILMKFKIFGEVYDEIFKRK
jgi:hypothetical protein